MDAQDWEECMGERNIARLVLDELGVNYNDWHLPRNPWIW
jgi:hypothetical protein